jgi:putative transposase
VLVTEGNGSERTFALAAVMELRERQQEILKRLQLMWVDAGYRGGRFALSLWLMAQAKVEVIARTGRHEDKILRNSTFSSLQIEH